MACGQTNVNIRQSPQIADPCGSRRSLCKRRLFINTYMVIKFCERGSIFCYRTLGPAAHHVLSELTSQFLSNFHHQSHWLYWTILVLYVNPQASALILTQLLPPPPINWFYATSRKGLLQCHEIIEWHGKLFCKKRGCEVMWVTEWQFHIPVKS